MTTRTHSSQAATSLTQSSPAQPYPAQPPGVRTGVLLMAYGSPTRPDEVEAYYTHIRGGRRPSPQAVEELRARYEAIGGASPLNEITARQGQALQRALGDGWAVYVGMRHWAPWIADAVKRMASDGIRQAVGLALAPQYSRMSVELYIEAAEAARRELRSGQLELSYVRSWCRHPVFVGALARRVRRQLAQPGFGEAHVLFTAHSLPRRILEWDDPYPRELQETCQAVASAVGLGQARWSVAYQSQGRTPEPWLGPTLEEALKDLARQGVRQVVVCPAGFVADHLEVLYDIDVEGQAVARELGMALTRTQSLNDAPDFIEALAAIVRERMADGTGTLSPASGGAG